MSITVFLRKEQFVVEDKSISVGELFKKMDLSPQAFLAVRNLNLLTEKDMLNDGDEVRIIPVISGGCGR